jgi:hypothetical protein
MACYIYFSEKEQMVARVVANGLSHDSTMPICERLTHKEGRSQMNAGLSRREEFCVENGWGRRPWYISCWRVQMGLFTFGPHEIHQGKWLRFYQYVMMLIWLMNICLALFFVGGCACIQ